MDMHDAMMICYYVMWVLLGRPGVYSSAFNDILIIVLISLYLYAADNSVSFTVHKLLQGQFLCL